MASNIPVTNTLLQTTFPIWATLRGQQWGNYLKNIQRLNKTERFSFVAVANDRKYQLSFDRLSIRQKEDGTKIRLGNTYRRNLTPGLLFSPSLFHFSCKTDVIVKRAKLEDIGNKNIEDIEASKHISSSEFFFTPLQHFATT